MTGRPAARRARGVGCVRTVLAAGWLLAAAVVPAFGQNPTAALVHGQEPEFAPHLNAWQAVLNHAAGRIATGDLDDRAYETLRSALTRLQAEAREDRAATAAVRDSARLMLDSLGAASATEQAPEAMAVAAERKRLSDRITELDGHGKQADLVVARAGILLRTLADQRMTRLRERVLTRGPIPLLPSTWAELPDQIADVRDRIGRAVDALTATLDWRERFQERAGFAAALLLLGLPMRRLLRRSFGFVPVMDRPRYRQRVKAMAVEAVADSLMPVVPTVVFTSLLIDLLRDVPDTEPLGALVLGLSGGIVAFFLTTGITYATLAPGYPEWQLADLAPGRARPLARRITIAASGLAVAGTGISLAEGMVTPTELRSVIGFGTMMLIAASLWVVLPGRLWVVAPPAPAGGGPEGQAAEPPDQRTAWPRWRLLVGTVSATSLAAAALGHLAAAVYASKLMVAAIIVGGVLHTARGVFREMWCALLEPRDGPLADVCGIIGARDTGREFLGQAGRVAIDGALLAAATVILLPLTGASLSELHDLADSLLGGVTIAGVRIAPAGFVKAVLLLSAVLAATRFLQRHLDDWILGKLSIDSGVRHSIRTGLGYLGSALAVLAAVGALGLDLSSLAMIASALSVGIGFGLQTIVSNFIAGLILLVERPVKVGDWVVVEGVEGVVRRISVRATEIQTFQRASVIIPNSEFVSKVVVNWTLIDKTTRVEIKIGVGYDSDVRLVHDLLLQIAREHPQVLRSPPPDVAFRNFGTSALEFELRFFLANTDIIQAVRNDIRMRILDAFRARGITFPYDQRDVHMPRMETLFESFLASRGAARSAPPVAAEDPVG